MFGNMKYVIMPIVRLLKAILYAAITFPTIIIVGIFVSIWEFNFKWIISMFSNQQECKYFWSADDDDYGVHPWFVYKTFTDYIFDRKTRYVDLPDYKQK